MPKEEHHPGLHSVSDPKPDASKKTPLWQAIILPIVAVLVFFLLLEGGLALFGFKPALQTKDPFVGFAANAPLFVPVSGPNDRQEMITAANKKDYFNRQRFPLDKGPNTFRIFCLGGSTTYGRPYDDATSFAGWLRELLPATDRNKNWEVINAGGISYASYRVAHLMEELIKYQPDLFVIYTGHNEFLEERTYRKLRDMPPLVRSTASLLARTRTWAVMSATLQSLHIAPRAPKDDRVKLAGEVDAILDRSAGPERYTRDEALTANILQHYRISLEHMVKLARSVGAKVLFVTPASNLKDCSPFKSQHTDGIDNGRLKRSEDLRAMSTVLAADKEWKGALRFLDEATKLDPRFAELHYRRGQALLALGRFAEAKKAFILARDEDVCPLRAVTPMRQIVMDVANENGVMLVDFVDLLQRRMQSIQGYDILGKEYFFDHVHPTIEGHKILAVALVGAMARHGLAHAAPGWDRDVVPAVAAKIEGGIDQATYGMALANLARVLLWAGKSDDAARLARQALEVGSITQQVGINASSILSTVYVQQGQRKRALQLLYDALAKAPGAVELRLQLGKMLLDLRTRNLEEAAANFLIVTQLMPYYDMGYTLFGIDMAERGRSRIAFPSLMQALRLNPNNSDARKKLAQIRPLVGKEERSPQPALIQSDLYPSTAPRMLVQGYNTGNRFIPDGIEVFFYENGRIKQFTDYENGLRNGDLIHWDSDGRILSHQVYRRGLPVGQQAK